MTNQDNGDNTNPGTGPTIEHDPNEARKKGVGLTTIVGIGIAAVIAIGAGAAVAGGGGWAKGGMHGMGMRFAEHRFEKVMDEIDATDEQQDKIWAIVDKTRADLRPVGREFRDSREEAMAILSAPTIDKAAVETMRASRIAAIDAASKKAVAALVEAAEVLTPEQRAKLAAEMKDRHGDRW